MAQTAHPHGIEGLGTESLDFPRHSAFVRITHWITAASFFALLVSGIAILIAHPRLYWGETGGIGAPSLIDLPIRLKLGHSGWGRYLHFLAAWICVLTGVVYALVGYLTGHFRKNLLPARALFSRGHVSRIISCHLWFRRLADDGSLTYNLAQRITYLAVIFVLFPLVILTGFAMSPGITSVFPVVVNVFGGQQSARTIHFIVSVLLVLFLFVHIFMVFRAGFCNRVGAMIMGHTAAGKEHT